MKSRALLYPGIVEKVMKPRDPRDPEKAQVVVDGADRLYREIRIDNTLNDANGQEVALKPGAPVEVTVAVDPDCQEVKTAQETPVVRAGFRSGSPVREALLTAGLSAGRAGRARESDQRPGRSAPCDTLLLGALPPLGASKYHALRTKFHAVSGGRAASSRTREWRRNSGRRTGSARRRNDAFSACLGHRLPQAIR